MTAEQVEQPKQDDRRLNAALDAYNAVWESWENIDIQTVALCRTAAMSAALAVTDHVKTDVTPEMVEAGLEFFYGVAPFCDRPASKEEIIPALRSAYAAMLSKARSA